MSSSLGASFRRSRSSWRRLFFSLALSLPSCIDTSSVATRWWPVTRRCSVRKGSNTVSSWSLPIAAWPLDASTPTTVQENCLMRSCSPSPSCPGLPPKISRRTVSPTMQVAAPARCSSSSKVRPLASFQLPVSNQLLLLPVTLVAQLRPLPITVTPARPSGATAATPPICASTASASAALNDGAPPLPPPGPWRWPGRTISSLLPRLAICVCTAWVAPLPSVTIVITADTPITMPRIVRKERSRFRRIDRSASSKVLRSIRSQPRPPAGSRSRGQFGRR